MRIPNTTTSDTLIGNLQRLTARQSQLQQSVSTGQRISRPSDDPQAASHVLDIEAEKQRLQQYARNSNQALSVSQTAFAAVDQLKDISTRSGELAVLGSGITSSDATQSYATELNQLIEQGLEKVNSSYGGDRLFGGTKTDINPFVATRDSSGKITGITYQGAAASAAIRTSEAGTITPTPDGASNQQLGDFLNHLVSLRDALQANDSSAVQGLRPALATSENHLLTTISEIGATQARLEADQSQNQTRFADLDKLTSKEVDADLSSTVVQLSQAQTSYQAALQAGAKLLGMSLLDYVR